MRRREFEKLILEVVAELPPEFQQHIHNLDIVVKWRPSPAELRRAGLRYGGTLFGLYLGVPLTRRGAHYNMALPDKIVIYQEPHERLYASPQEMAQQVRQTLLHEIGHYMGIDEKRLRELGVG